MSGFTDAARALGRGQEVLEPAGRAGLQHARIDDDVLAFESDVVAVHAPGCGARDVLTGQVVDRAVTGTLEASRARTERNVTTEVGALLREREQIVVRVDHVHAPGGHVGARVGAEARDLADRDLGAPRAARQRTERLVAGVRPGADQQRAGELPTTAPSPAPVSGWGSRGPATAR